MRTKPMTEGERAVWAAVFAAEYQPDLRKLPSFVASMVPSEREQWEVEHATSAAESASYALLRLRDANSYATDCFGKHNVVSVFLRQIVGKEAQE